MVSYGNRRRDAHDFSKDEWMDNYIDWPDIPSVQTTHGNGPLVEVPPAPALGRALSNVGQEHRADFEDGPFPAMSNSNDPLAGISGNLSTMWRSDAWEDAWLLQHSEPFRTVHDDPFALYEPLVPPTSFREDQDPISDEHPTQDIEELVDIDPFPKHQHQDGSWSCRVDGCSKQAKRHRLESDLKKHQRKHEKKSFLCHAKGCKFSARFAHHFARHETSVHGDAIYYCRQCPRSYNTHHNLRRHYRKKHPGTEIPKQADACIDPAAVDSEVTLHQPDLIQAATAWYGRLATAASPLPWQESAPAAATMLRSRRPGQDPRAEQAITSNHTPSFASSSIAPLLTPRQTILHGASYAAPPSPAMSYYGTSAHQETRLWNSPDPSQALMLSARPSVELELIGAVTDVGLLTPPSSQKHASRDGSSAGYP
ncbi:hypothetical protein LTS10_002631 [Elasticomyces elasticus]|nr:hypothetical protein LTS10_002631 [Elasticomyces elasticus]